MRHYRRPVQRRLPVEKDHVPGVHLPVNYFIFLFQRQHLRNRVSLNLVQRLQIDQDPVFIEDFIRAGMLRWSPFHLGVKTLKLPVLLTSPNCTR